MYTVCTKGLTASESSIPVTKTEEAVFEIFFCPGKTSVCVCACVCVCARACSRSMYTHIHSKSTQS